MKFTEIDSFIYPNCERDLNRLDKIYTNRVDNFSCPLNKSPSFCICNGCPMKLSKKCNEWTKKLWRGACGCTGIWNCQCGFEYWTCVSPLYLSNCPYCDRNLPQVSKGFKGLKLL